MYLKSKNSGTTLTERFVWVLSIYWVLFSVLFHRGREEKQNLTSASVCRPFSQLALFIAFLCVYCARGWPSWAAFQYFEVVTLWFFIALLIFFLMHLFRLQAKMPCINWSLTVWRACLFSIISQSHFCFFTETKQELTGCFKVLFVLLTVEIWGFASVWIWFLLLQEYFHYCVGTILILIGSIVAIVKGSGVSALVAGSVRVLLCFFRFYLFSTHTQTLMNVFCFCLLVSDNRTWSCTLWNSSF